MSHILHRFQSFHGQNTQQVGQYFCIPASISNSLRILGFDTFTQERIRDLWYADQSSQPDPDINKQMIGFSFESALRILSLTPEFVQFSYELFSRPGDHDLLDLQKSHEALTFVERHLAQEHPVIISTQVIPWEQGILQVVGYHMLLALEIKSEQNICIIHDPGTNMITAMQIDQSVYLRRNGATFDFPVGLLGKITHSDYNCLALWRK